MSKELKEFIQKLDAGYYATSPFLHHSEIVGLSEKLKNQGIKVSAINNRRYLGNKYSLSEFIRDNIDAYCPNSSSLIDIFSGTGAVAHAFLDKDLIVNDLLYFNYLSAVCWFDSHGYRPYVIIDAIAIFNRIRSRENNYVRQNFANTYFSADDCSKIGVIRETIEKLYSSKRISFKEFSILVTSLIYGMDHIANTVGHYDAYRKNTSFDKEMVLPVLLPRMDMKNNHVYNENANALIENLEADILYLDPPYNSRQYSDSYHFLENIARWEKPEVFGVARKMDRTALKSDYSTNRATQALKDLVNKANVKYIVLSYNNMADKGNGRSNAKMSDDDIMAILQAKGSVKVIEKPYKAFSVGNSHITNNVERLFICTVCEDKMSTSQPAIVHSPINYIGGKGKLMPQIQPMLKKTRTFVDVFAGGCTVGANTTSKRVIFNDTNSTLINLMRMLTSVSSNTIIRDVDSIIAKYGLSDTYRHLYSAYGVDSAQGLAGVNRSGFVRLRNAYNSCADEEQKTLLLYVLTIYSFNNQIRFNNKGLYNLPVGKRDFNAKMRNKLIEFNKRFQSLSAEFISCDFRDINIENYDLDCLFYCDPPYLITNATYNEKGGWTPSDEEDLLHFLDRIDQSGRYFALSNVIQTKGTTNEILNTWVKDSHYMMRELDMSYRNSNYQRAHKNSTTLEVLITNY